MSYVNMSYEGVISAMSLDVFNLNAINVSSTLDNSSDRNDSENLEKFIFLPLEIIFRTD